MQAKERSYETMLSFGKRGLNIAASAAVQAATKVPWAPALQQSSQPRAFWVSPALYQGAEREQLTMPGNRMRGDRWGVGRSVEREVDFLGWDSD